ncbi:hypothetical protein B0A52_09228 [Exophiala mesophila]|uniref:Uncharacterized protein n=1 Tax=Exophiala mesophila TaxID=212818 RepID=A0A438MTK4_EXOME|nr:hypothetical protein B0A52_09228 [Exophiala mesophila]
MRTIRAFAEVSPSFDHPFRDNISGLSLSHPCHMATSSSILDTGPQLSIVKFECSIGALPVIWMVQARLTPAKLCISGRDSKAKQQHNAKVICTLKSSDLSLLCTQEGLSVMSTLQSQSNASFPNSPADDNHTSLTLTYNIVTCPCAAEASQSMSSTTASPSSTSTVTGSADPLSTSSMDMTTIDPTSTTSTSLQCPGGFSSSQPVDGPTSGPPTVSTMGRLVTSSMAPTSSTSISTSVQSTEEWNQEALS